MMDIFMMIATISRVNHSIISNEYKNNNQQNNRFRDEQQLCSAICTQIYNKHLQIYEDINRLYMNNNEIFALNIAAANKNAKGYFAPLFRFPEPSDESEREDLKQLLHPLEVILRI